MEKTMNNQLYSKPERLELSDIPSSLDYCLKTPMIRQSTIFLNDEDEKSCNIPATSTKNLSSASYFQDIEKITASTPSISNSKKSRCSYPYQSYTSRKTYKNTYSTGTFTSACSAPKEEKDSNLEDKAIKNIENNNKLSSVMNTFNSHLKKNKFSFLTKNDKSRSRLGVYSTSNSKVSQQHKAKCSKKISEILSERKVNQKYSSNHQEYDIYMNEKVLIPKDEISNENTSRKLHPSGNYFGSTEDSSIQHSSNEFKKISQASPEPPKLVCLDMSKISKNDQTFGDIVPLNQKFAPIATEKKAITLRTCRSTTDVLYCSKNLRSKLMEKSNDASNMKYRLHNQYISPSISPMRESSPCLSDAISMMRTGGQQESRNCYRSPSFVSNLASRSSNLIPQKGCQTRFELEIELKAANDLIRKLQDELHSIREDNKLKPQICKICKYKIKDSESKDIDKLLEEKLVKIKAQYEEDLEFEKQELKAKFECKMESLSGLNYNENRNPVSRLTHNAKSKSNTLVIPNFISISSNDSEFLSPSKITSKIAINVFQHVPPPLPGGVGRGEVHVGTINECNALEDSIDSEQAKKVIVHYKKLLIVEREKLLNKMVEIESRMSKSLLNKDQQIEDLKHVIKVYKAKYGKYKKLAMLENPS